MQLEAPEVQGHLVEPGKLVDRVLLETRVLLDRPGKQAFQVPLVLREALGQRDLLGPLDSRAAPEVPVHRVPLARPALEARQGCLERRAHLGRRADRVASDSPDAQVSLEDQGLLVERDQLEFQDQRAIRAHRDRKDLKDLQERKDRWAAPETRVHLAVPVILERPVQEADQAALDLRAPRDLREVQVLMEILDRQVSLVRLDHQVCLELPEVRDRRELLERPALPDQRVAAGLLAALEHPDQLELLVLRALGEGLGFQVPQDPLDRLDPKVQQEIVGQLGLLDRLVFRVRQVLLEVLEKQV